MRGLYAIFACSFRERIEACGGDAVRKQYSGHRSTSRSGMGGGGGGGVFLVLLLFVFVYGNQIAGGLGPLGQS